MLRSPVRVLDVGIGVAILVLGLAGVLSTATHPAEREQVFGLFAANLPQALVHVVLGGALVAAGAAAERIARIAAQLGGTLLLALGIAGLFLVDSGIDVLALGASDNLAHFCAAVVLLTAGFGIPERAGAS